MDKHKMEYNKLLCRWHNAEIFEGKGGNMDKYIPELTKIAGRLSVLLNIIGTYTKDEVWYGFVEGVAS